MTKSENAVPSYDVPDGVKFLSPYSAGDYLPLSCADLVGLIIEQNLQNHLCFKKRKAKYLLRMKSGQLWWDKLHEETLLLEKA